MKPGSSGFGLVVGIVLMISAVLIIIAFAGDPKTCADAMCGSAR